MSKAGKLAIVSLFLLLAAACGLSMLTVMEKEKVTETKAALEKQVEGYQTREEKHVVHNNKLKDKIKELESVKTRLEEQLDEVEEQLDEMDVSDFDSEREEWKKRVDALIEERDDLSAKLQEKPGKEIVYQYLEREPGQEGVPAEAPPALAGKVEEDDSYWAQVLKVKASLEVELEEFKTSLSKSSLDIAELKRENTDLQLALNKIENEKELIEREIKHGDDLSDILSLQLARTQNDNRFLNDRMGRIVGENTNLHQQVRQLISTKIALEKSIVRLQGEKKDLTRRVFETENVIQSRIDEIRQISESLEKTFEPVVAIQASSGEIELSPIIVSARMPEVDFIPDFIHGPLVGVGVSGNIVSVNEANNFVIVDIGEKSGIQLGDTLNVYRDSEYVAGLEVIQIRKDIAAADIKKKIVGIQVGDAVK